MGYKALRINGKKIDEHRFIMEKHLGRKLKSSEIVHHIDGDKQNNKINNLMLFPTKSAHTKFHIQEGDLKLLDGNNKKELFNGKLLCVKCGILKELKDFTKNVRAYLGVIGVCKNCRKLQKRHWKRKG